MSNINNIIIVYIHTVEVRWVMDNVIDNADDFVFAVRVLFKVYTHREIIDGTSSKDLFGDKINAMAYRGLTVVSIPNSVIVEPHWNREVVEKIYEMLKSAYLKDKTNADLRLIYSRQFRKDLGL